MSNYLLLLFGRLVKPSRGPNLFKKELLNLFIVSFAACVIMGCQTSLFDSSDGLVQPQKSLDDVYRGLGIIEIVPLGSVRQSDLNAVESGLRSFYGQQVVIKNRKELSSDLRRTPQSRYSAELILAKYKSNTQTVLVTSSDITFFKKDKNQDWGIFGLGHRPGRTCIVSASNQRLGKNVSEETKISRLRKVAIHEVGHNLGLFHCPSSGSCVMRAANGKGSQVDLCSEEFCANCISFLLK